MSTIINHPQPGGDDGAPVPEPGSREDWEARFTRVLDVLAERFPDGAPE